VVLAPATILYVKARSERDRRLFTPAELCLLAAILVGGAFGVFALATGRIVL